MKMIFIIKNIGDSIYILKMNNNKNSLLIKEACVDSFNQARKAEMLGANRLEICKDLHLDGLTPKIDVVNKIINEFQFQLK